MTVALSRLSVFSRIGFMKHAQVIAASLWSIVVFASTLLPGEVAATAPASDPATQFVFANWKSAAGHAAISIENRTPDATAPSLKLEWKTETLDGIEYSWDAPVSWAGKEALSVIVVTGGPTHFCVRVDDVNSKSYKMRFNYETDLPIGVSRVLLPLETIGKKLDLTKIRRVVLFCLEKPVGGVLWFDAVQVGEPLAAPPMTPEQWAAVGDKTVPDPYSRPDPNMVLWHSYNERLEWEDVPDFSRHGSIGEFNSADKIRTDAPKTANRGLRLYGEFARGKSVGYHIMPSDDLKLKEGTVSFWAIVDGAIQTKTGIILAAGGQSGRKNHLGIANGKRGTVMTVSFGGKITAGDVPVNEWIHVAWVFDANSQELFINGTSRAKIDKGASLDGTRGLFVGNDGAKWARNHSGGGGFAGVIDDLRIFNKKMTDFPGLKSPPNKAFPKLGMVLWYDFDGDAVKDKSGNGLDGSADKVEKNVPGMTKWRKNDKAWAFSTDVDNGGAFLEIAPNPIFDLPVGMMSLRFKITPTGKEHKGTRYYVFLPFRKPCLPLSRPAFMIAMEYLDKTKMKMIIDHHTSLDSTNLYSPKKTFKSNEWIKVVLMWHQGENSKENVAALYIDDKFVDRFPSTFRLFGPPGPIRLGTYPHDATFFPGANMAVSDLKIYNYFPSVYVPGF